MGVRCVRAGRHLACDIAYRMDGDPFDAWGVDLFLDVLVGAVRGFVA